MWFSQLLERLRFTFTPNGRREFVPRGQISPLFSVHCFYTKLSSPMPVLTTGIVEDCFYLLILYSEKFSSWVWRLPFAVNLNLYGVQGRKICWVSCAIKKRGFFEIAFVSTHICLALRPLLVFASLWRTNSRSDSCVLGVHLSNVCWGLLFCLRKAFIFWTFAESS